MIDQKQLSKLHEICCQAEAYPVLHFPKNNEELNTQVDTALDLGDLNLQYRAKKNPLHLMEAFNRAVENSFNIPIWVLVELYSAFDTYKACNGEKSLDEILKIEGRGLGGTPSKRLLVENVERGLAEYVATLRRIGFTLRVSCSLVSYRSLNIASVQLSEARIIEIYKHYRSIEGHMEWFGKLWGDESDNPELCWRYIMEGGFWVGNDEAWSLNSDMKPRKSYDKTISKILDAYVLRLKATP